MKKIKQSNKTIIGETLFKLLKTTSYEKITITTLCKASKVARKTFYNNFDSKDSVLTFILDGIFFELAPYIDMPFISPKDILLYVFKFIEKHKNDLLLFYKRGLFGFARAAIVKYITKDRFLTHSNKYDISTTDFMYHSAVISAIIAEVIEIWIKNNFNQSVDYLAKFINNFLYKNL